MWRRLPCIALMLLCAGCGDLANRDSELLIIAEVYNKGDAETTATKLEEYLERKPENDLAHTIFGHALEDLDRDEEAEAAYLRALELNPERVEALTGLGILYRKKGMYDQSMAYYEQSVALDPDYAPAWSSMTAIALKQGQDDKAVAYGRRAYELDRKDPVIAANLAVAYHYNGDYEERDKLTERARSLGYTKMQYLDQIYTGKLTIRD